MFLFSHNLRFNNNNCILAIIYFELRIPISHAQIMCVTRIYMVDFKLRGKENKQLCFKLQNSPLYDFSGPSKLGTSTFVFLI